MEARILWMSTDLHHVDGSWTTLSIEFGVRIKGLGGCIIHRDLYTGSPFGSIYFHQAGGIKESDEEFACTASTILAVVGFDNLLEF